ncbi:FKBP-type peptidyl-prolyl cis-trans isomerase [Enterobacter ludwigii]|uniref:FKBP-type peptidyl-prolyl cis-trans isomerase n=1 Tax=Enterobacter ludwigii TaxID=299767 RepID=UPI00242AA560|nr:FKBP-type peptidyl-prolyl cis-trans isomerase [Enterobacter ludwigii]WGA03943.1 FKBP-type peptidyl-prolyl cis-trans isomerase [Enterobacter ludwigii]
MMKNSAGNTGARWLPAAGGVLMCSLLAAALPVLAEASSDARVVSGESVEQQLNTLRAQLEQQRVLLQTLQSQRPVGRTDSVTAVTPDTGASTPPVPDSMHPEGAPPEPASPAQVQGGGEGASRAPDAAATSAGGASSLPLTPATAVPASVPPVQPSAPTTGGTPLPDDENARRAYASGVSLAREMQQSLAVQKALGITLPSDVLMEGLQDAFNHHPLRMKDGDIQDRLSALNADFTSRMQAQRADEVTRGREFRAAFRKQKGVLSDAGSLYLVSVRGASPRLRTTDMATLQVTGRLPDGTVFDGSGQAGQARKVRVSAMLPAIAIGLQKIGVGGHITIVVPPEKGYGDMGLPPTVPGGATLIFDITVQGVNEGG